ncbi:YfhO family protein [Pseudodesulfovibrio sp.]|nr:YfhO family protein [Pseudodesulfovibrio sp.]
MALLAFFTLSFIMYFDSFFLGKYSLVPYADFMDSSFVLNLKLYAESMAEFGLFSWFQPLLGGMPGLVALQPSWTLRTAMAGIMPLWMVMAIINMFVIGVAGYGMFRLLRSYFGLDPKTSFITGVLYVLACPWPYNYIWACYFPLSIVHVDELTDSKTSMGGKILRLSMFCGFTLASLPVFTLPEFSIGHFCFVLLFDKSEEKLKHLWVVFLLWTGYFFVFVPYFVDLFQYVPNVSRVYPLQFTGVVDALVSMKSISPLLRENIVVALLIFLLPMLRFVGRARLAFIYALVPLGICAFIGSDFFYFFKDSFIVKMDLIHSIQLFYFGSVLFCGFALHAFREQQKRVNLVWAVAAVLVLRLYCNEAQMIRAGAALTFALVAANPSGVFLTVSRKTTTALVAGAACIVCAFLILEQRETLKFTHVPFARSFGEYAELERIAEEQKGYDFRVACLDLHPSAARYYGLDTLGARHVLINKYYKEYFAQFMRPMFASEALFTRFMVQDYDTYTTPRTDNRDDLLFESFYPEIKRSATDWNMPMLLAMGVKYIVSPKPIDGIEVYADAPVKDLGLRLPGPFADSIAAEYYSLPIYIYPVREPFKMAWFAPNVRRFDSRTEVLQSMADETRERLGSTLFIYAEDAEDIESVVGGGKGYVTEVRREMDVMTVTGTATGPGYMLMAVNYDPRWSCSVNGEETAIFRANHAFQAVAINSAGPFEVKYVYHDPIVDLAYWAPGIGLLLIVSALFITAKSSMPPYVPADKQSWLFDLTRPGQWRLLALGGIGASFLWIIGFFSFVYSRHAASVLAPYGYMLGQVPVLGVLLTCWVCLVSHLGRRR